MNDTRLKRSELSKHNKINLSKQKIIMGEPFPQDLKVGDSFSQDLNVGESIITRLKYCVNEM